MSDLVTIDGFFGPDSSLSSKLAQEAYGAEAQHLFRSRFVDVTSGLGYFDIDGETLQAFSFGPGIVEEAVRTANAHALRASGIAPADQLCRDLPGDAVRARVPQQHHRGGGQSRLEGSHQPGGSGAREVLAGGRPSAHAAGDGSV